ncbi:hypothetical protein D3C84_635480 [compost metagenome]
MEIDTLGMLLVERHRQRYRQLAQLVLSAVQGLASEAHQATQLAFAEGGVGELEQVARGIAVTHHDAAGFLGGAHRLELEAVAATDQTQPVAQAQVVGVAILYGQTCVDPLAQLGDQLVALVEQAVRRLAGLGRCQADLAIELGDLLGSIVDLGDLILDLPSQTALHVAEVTVEGAELAGQGFCRTQHTLASRRVGGRCHHILQRGEEVAHQRRQPGLAIGHQVVDLADLGVVAAQATGHAIAAIQLVADELVELALDIGHLHTRPGNALAQLGQLTVVARGIDIADVATGGRQHRLRAVQAADANGKDAHEAVPVEPCSGYRQHWRYLDSGPCALPHIQRPCIERITAARPGGWDRRAPGWPSPRSVCRHRPGRWHSRHAARPVLPAGHRGH